MTEIYETFLQPGQCFLRSTLYFRGMVKEWSPGAEEYAFPGLRHCVSGGEPLNEEVISTWRRRTGIDIKEGYGQTETVLVAGTFKVKFPICQTRVRFIERSHVKFRV